MSEPPSSFLFKTSRGGCWERLDLRGPKSSFLSFISFYFLDDRTSTPSQGIFQFQPPSNHRKDTKTSKKNILSSPPLKISDFLLEKSRKSRKIKKKQEFYEERKIEKIMRLLLLQGIILVSSQEVRSSVQSLNGIF